MTITVLKVPDGKDLYEVVCQECDALLRFERSDAVIVDLQLGEALQLVCPNCNSSVTKYLNKKISSRIVRPETYNHVPK